MAHYMMVMGWMELRGRGLPIVRQEMRAFNGTEPRLFNSTEGRFVRLSLMREKLPKGDLDDTRAASSLADWSEDQAARLGAAILAARGRAESLDPEGIGGSLGALDDLAAEATENGFLSQAFEARLAMAEIELAAGETTEADRRLEALIEDAEARGFGLVVSRARRLRGQ
jgi:hypothetical protein